VTISDYLRLARQYIFVLLCVPLVLGVAGLLSARSQAKVYRSTAQVLLRPNDPNERVGTSGATGTEILNADRIVQAQANIAKGPTVRKAAAAKLGSVTEQELLRAVAVSPAANSNILSISADDIDPLRASVLANAVAAAFIENRRVSSVVGLETAIADLDDKIAQLQRLVADLAKPPSDPARAAQLDDAQAQSRSLSDRRLLLAVDKNLKKGEAELIATAAAEDEPISPRPMRTGALAGILGLGTVAGAVLLKDRLDTRLRSREDAEETSGLATLAEVPVDRAADRGALRIAAEDEPDGLVAEAIRSLRVSLRFLGLEEPVKVILVTSALPGDGKSTVSVNLAHSYAESGARTLLVSADLRAPQVERMSAVSSERGLVELFDEMASAHEQSRQDRNSRVRERVLIGAAAITHYCHNDIPNLWVLPAGQRVANPVEILGSAVAKEFFARAAEDFDAVIIDSPPVLAVADAVVLSQFVDGVLVVTSIRKTQRPALARAVEVLRNGQANALGLVLNRVGGSSGYGYGSGYGQTYGYGATRRDTGLGAFGAFARRVTGRRRSTPSSGRRAA
jgi:polysaccharide biosynthesis transport protein